MTSTCRFLGSPVLETDIVCLEEEHKKPTPEKLQEVDEACYSLEDPEQDETKAFAVFRGFLGSESYKKKPTMPRSFALTSSSEQRSFPEPLISRGIGGDGIPMRTNVLHSETLIPRGFEGGPEILHHSNDIYEENQLLSNASIPPAAAEVQLSAESCLPDFDRLLSDDSENEADVLEIMPSGHSSSGFSAELSSICCDAELFFQFNFSSQTSLDIMPDGLSEEDSSWTEEVCSGIVEMLQMAVQCNDPICGTDKCQIGQKMIDEIESDLENDKLMSSLVSRRLLAAVIISHSSFCDVMQCSVPWCSFFSQCQEHGVEEQLAALQSHYRKINDFQEICVNIPETSTFIQLDSDVNWPCVELTKYERDVSARPVPRNGIDFIVDGHFGKCGQLALTALSTTLPAVQLNIIQYVSYEKSDELWDDLKGIRHDSIVRHLWSCVDGNSVTVCRDHFCTSSESLESLVNKVKQEQRNIDTTVAIGYVTGLVSAVKYLNDRDIYYLRWTAGGIQMNYHYTGAQLSDFSSAVRKTTIEADEEMVDLIANSLPPSILPPEIFSDDDSVGRISSCAEVWGVGCIIYHVSCGQPVHYNLRHESPENVREAVEDFAPEDHLNLVKLPKIKEILALIFTVEERRVGLLQLKNILEKFLAHSRS